MFAGGAFSVAADEGRLTGARQQSRAVDLPEEDSADQLANFARAGSAT
jgi:hypothetical protein